MRLKTLQKMHVGSEVPSGVVTMEPTIRISDRNEIDS
jgi:hypothetical protein